MCLTVNLPFRTGQREKTWILCDLPEGIAQVCEEAHDLQDDRKPILFPLIITVQSEAKTLCLRGPKRPRPILVLEP